MLGFKLIGQSTSNHVIIMHDWSSDITSYEDTVKYLDTDKFSYIFVDLRGYGKSRNIEGEYTYTEAAQDVLQLANSLGVQQFHVVGHSMSALVAQHLAFKYPERVRSMVLVTPVPACGSPMPDEDKRFAQSAADASSSNAEQLMHSLSGNRLTDGFARYKVQHWYECSSLNARLGYLEMFTESNFADQVSGLQTETLVIIGEHDPAYNLESMQESILRYYPNNQAITIADSGHYPMQETPALFVSHIEKFFLGL